MAFPEGGREGQKLVLIMKLTFFIFFIFIMQVSASVYSQTTKLTFDFRGEKVSDILKEIEETTNFRFFYQREQVDVDRRVNLQVKNKNVNEVLNALFQDQGVTYKIMDDNLILLTSANSNATASQQPRNVTGKVLNEKGDPIPGVTIVVKGTTMGTIADAGGNYMLSKVPADATLVFSFVGMKTQEVKVDSRSRINITLAEETVGLDEVVAVGYGVQKKVTLTGAVSAVSNDEIISTKNENVQNMLSGKIVGVRVVQKSSEPGSFNNTFDIRGLGDPLIIIDGIPRDNMSRLDPEDIESVSVLKDASAAIYGVRAANGVVLITTKKGKSGSMEIEYSANFCLQTPTGSPKSCTAAEWMTLANEASMHNQSGGSLRYSDDEITAYTDGTKTGTDWYGTIMRKSAPQTQHTISARGGNDRTQYYTSVGYMYQESFLRSNSNNYDRYNLRSNVTSKITDRLTIDVKMNGIMDQSNKNYESTDWIIRSMERSSPIQPVYANNNPDYIQEGYVDGSNPLAMSDADMSGYRKYNNKWFQSSVSLEYDIPYIKGLKAKVLFSYDYQVIDNKIYEKEYNLYDYDDASGTYEATTHQSPSTIRREFYTKQSALHQFYLTYERTFNESHHVKALFLYEGQRSKGDNIYAQRELSIPLDELSAGNSDDQEGSMSTDSGDFYDNSNMGFVGRLNYDFKSRYLAEFSFRYDGSSKFASGHQWGFFPSASIGWRISEENFWKALNFSYIDNLKIRASYGKLGDDNASTYQYLTGYSYPADGDYNNLPGGYFFDGSYVNSSVSTGIANENITWYTSKTLDLGLDLDSWNGMLGITFDYFRRERDGLLGTRSSSLPSVVGADLPEENLNGDLTRGFDLEINHHYHLGKVNYSVKALCGLTRKEYTHQEVGTFGSSYDEWRNNTNNRYSDIVWGYSGKGQFQSYGEIANSSVKYSDSTLPGDYKYDDWNGDGIISDLDIHPIDYSGRPMMNFGLTLAASWKGFDVSVLFQGVAKSSVAYTEILAQPNWGSDYSNSLKMFWDRWHPVDPTADPYDPNTEWIKGKYPYTGTVSESNSTFRYNDAGYIRLKSAEVGYTLPISKLIRWGIKSARLYVNGYNLYTWSKMEYIDPEHPSDSYGNVYPLNRTFTVGLNVKF